MDDDHERDPDPAGGGPSEPAAGGSAAAMELDEARQHSVRAPFRYPVFRTLWTAQFAAFISLWLQTVGAQWYLTAAGAAAVTVAMVQTATTLPSTIMGLPAGVIADLLDRRKALLTVQTLGAVGGFGLAIASWADVLSAPLLLGTIFMLGVGLALAGPMWQVILPEIVPRQLLPTTALLTAMTYNSSRIIGPAIGGFLVSLAGTGFVFALNGVIFTVVGISVVRAYPHSAHAAGAERPRSALATGVRYVWYAPVVRRTLVRVLLWGLASSILYSLLPVVAREQLDADSSQFGLLLGGAGLGAVSGVGLLTWARRRWTPNAIVAVTSLMFAAGLLVLAFSTLFVLSLGAMVVTGFCWMSTLNTFSAAIQMALPSWVRGRGLASFTTTLQLTQALGSFAWGSVADLTSLATSYTVAAAWIAATVVSLVVLPVPRLDAADPTASARPTSLPEEPDEDADPSGPLQVEIEHRPDGARLDEFAAAMRTVHSARLRTGGRGWELRREGARWIESYRLSNRRELDLHRTVRYTREEERAIEGASALCREPSVHRIRGAVPTGGTAVASTPAGSTVTTQSASSGERHPCDATFLDSADPTT